MVAGQGQAGHAPSTSTRTWCGSSRWAPTRDPGEEMTRTRGDALQLIGHQHPDRRGHRDRDPAGLLRPHPGRGLEPGQRSALLRRPAADGGDGREPDRHPARLRVRDRVQEVQGDGRRHRRHRRGQPDGVQRHLPQAAGIRGREDPPQRLPALPTHGSARTLPGGDFDRSANQQRVLRGIQAKIHDRADQRGFIERGVLSAMAEHGDRRLARRAVPARARGRERASPPRSRPASCSARSATWAAPASCCRTSTRRAATATRPATTPPSSAADGGRAGTLVRLTAVMAMTHAGLRLPGDAEDRLERAAAAPSPGTPRSCSGSRRWPSTCRRRRTRT